MLRPGTYDDLPGVRALWDEAFPGDAFACWFFERLFDLAKLRVWDENGEIVSMLFAFPREFFVPGGRPLRAWYLYGIATRRTHRGQGIAGQLIDDCLKEAAQHGMDVCFLVPQEVSLFDFYHAHGFEPKFFLKNERLRAHRNRHLSVLNTIARKDFVDLDRLYTQAWEKHLYLKRNEQDWTLIGENLRNAGGDLYLLKESEETVGYACVYPKKERLYISELTVTDPFLEAGFRNAVAEVYGAEELELLQPGGETPFAAVAMLTNYARECFDGRFVPYCNLLYN